MSGGSRDTPDPLRPAPQNGDGEPAPSSRATGSPVGGLAQNYGGISGNASCTSDSGAFAGPLSPG